MLPEKVKLLEVDTAGDERIPAPTLAALREAWQAGLAHAHEAGKLGA